MVDRTFVYTGQIPLDTDILRPQRNMEVGIGALAQAVIGQQAVTAAFAADGFAITPTSPATLVMNIGPGSVYAQGVIDQTNYGSIPADLTEITTLQGISLDAIGLTFTPPGTGGFATNYLVEIAISTVDGSPVVLNYVNANSPLSLTPWSGPNNSGASQNTIRQCTVSLVAKAGIPASAGSQVTPAPDPGFFGLWVVTVANGATQLTLTQTALYANNPFIPSALCSMPQAFQSNKWSFAPDTGTANAMAASLSPAPLSIVAGMSVTTKKSGAGNTGPCSFNLNGGGAISIHTVSGAALVGGEMPANSMIGLRFDGTFWQLATVATSSFGGPLFTGSTTGTNTYVVSNLSPAAGALVNQMMLICNFASPNTGSSTLNIGFGANPIVYTNGTPLIGGELTGQELVIYSTALGSWEILTPTQLPPGAPPVFVHSAPDTSAITNAITAAMAPPIGSYNSGHIYIITSVANTNTAGMTANFNGVGTRVVGHEDGTAMAPNEVTAGQTLVLVDNGSTLVCAFKVPPYVQVSLTAPQTYYVSTSGSDTNNGLSSGAAFLTIQHAVNTIAQFNLNNFNVTVNVANGTYSGSVKLVPPGGSGNINFVAATPGAALITSASGSAIVCGNGCNGYSFNGFVTSSTGYIPNSDPGAGVFVVNGSSIMLVNHGFGVCQGSSLCVRSSSTATMSGSLVFSGGCTSNAIADGSLISAGTCSSISTPPAGVALNFTVGLSATFFVEATNVSATSFLLASTANGSNFTGGRYFASNNGAIYVSGGGATYYPGTSPGSVTTGGQYS